MKVMHAVSGALARIRAGLIVVAVGALVATIVSVSPAAAQEEEPKPPLKIVQLGDSYSAGNGARNAAGDRSYYGISGCYRSRDNWGEKYADTLRDDFAVTYVNRACSGGTVTELLNQVREIDSGFSCPSVDYPDEEFVERDGVRCRKFLRRQLESVDESVDLVLMTGGGNDAEFAEIVKECFIRGFRDAFSCRDKVDNAATAINDIRFNLTTALLDMRNNRLRPDARVVFVAYPYLIDDWGYELESTRGIINRETLNYPAGDEVRRIGQLGEQAQREAIQAANAAAGEDFIIFVDDIKDLFDSHNPWPGSNLNAATRNPDSWLWHGLETRLNAEWYHYKPAGHVNIADLLIPNGPFGVTPADVGAGLVDLDVVFVVDTTGSMGDEIAQVRDNLSSLVDVLDERTNSYRVGVVTYRDFAERTGDAIDYPSRVEQTFTSDRPSIQAAIDGLSAAGGGDFPESVFSGIDAALDLPWRPGVAKIAIVIGDAPPLEPIEPISGLTRQDLIAKSLAIDPVQVIGVNVGSLLTPDLTAIIDGTGGYSTSGVGNLPGTLEEILNTAADQPFAWIGGPFVATTGETATFDASGSYDPSGGLIELYEWDFDGDGAFDLSTTSSGAEHVYAEDFDGTVVLRVSGPGGTALASARTVANAEGSVAQTSDEICVIDEAGLPIWTDGDGRILPCVVLEADWPEADAEGTIASVFDDGDGDGDGAELASALERLQGAVEGQGPGKALTKKADNISKKALAGNLADACDQLGAMRNQIRAQTGKKIAAATAAEINAAIDAVNDALGCS